MKPRIIRKVLCGELAVGDESSQVIHLVLGQGQGRRPNLRLDIENIEAALMSSLPDRLHDLLTIAGYVLGADCAVDRGRPSDVDLGREWVRQFEMHVPVFDVDFWRSEPVRQVLEETLGFLSDDYFTFTFTPRKAPRAGQIGIWAAATGPLRSWDHVQGVMLLSGGLDSYTGAVEEVLAERRQVIMVSHRASDTANKAQDRILAYLRERADKEGRPGPHHVGVRYRRSGKKLDRERTQRTRSFLFASLAGAVASLAGADSFKVFENGIVAFNLPIARQEIGARATRTAHPLALAGFAKLLASVLECKAFKILNPFMFDTRADVISRLVRLNETALIQATISCAHVIESSPAHPHCGTCSQCVDRRFALESLGLRWEEDDQLYYSTQIFTDELKDEQDQLFIVNYIEAADRWAATRSAGEFMRTLGESSVAVLGAMGEVPADASEAIRKLWEMHRRHGLAVGRVVNERFGQARRALMDNALRPNTLPMLLLGRKEEQVSPALTVIPDPTPVAPHVPPVELAAPAPPPAVDPEQRRVFRLRGEFWEVEFDGVRGHWISDVAGMRVIHRLLSQRGTRMTAFDVDSPGSGEKIATSSLGTKLDKRGKKRLAQRERTLLDDIQAANEAGQLDDVLDLQNELKMLKGEQKAGLAPGGRLRLDNDIAVQARDRVRRNYKTALKKLVVNYPALVKHLDTALSGIETFNPTYIDSGPAWILGGTEELAK